ncbi:MAG: AsmA-like C-terminal region-containing protein [Bacteroidales bacterium]
MVKSRVKRRIIVAAIITAALVIILAVTGILLEKKIKPVLLREINKQLTVKVDVSNISLSLWRSFPQADLLFTGVRIPSLPGDTTPFVNAESVSLRFSILDLVRKNYTIRHIEIRNGKLSLLFPDNGKPNYLIIREGEGEAEALEFALRRVLIRNVDVVYRDDPNKVVVDFTCRKTTFRGDFFRDTYKLKAWGDIVANGLQTGSDKFFSGQDAELDLIMEIDNRTGRYTISRGSLEVEGLPFEVDGEIETARGKHLLSLNLAGKGLRMDHLLELLPESYHHIREEYAPSGSINLTGTVIGSYAGGNTPGIDIAFGIENGTITHQSSGVQLSSLSFEGAYRYSSTENVISINNLKSSLGDGELHGSASVTNLNQPIVKLELYADLPVSELLEFFPMQQIESGEGRIRLALKGETAVSTTESFSKAQFLNSRTNGEIEFSDVSLALRGSAGKLTGINGKLLFDNNDVRMTDFQIVVNTSPFLIRGYGRNLLPYLITADQSLEFQGSITSEMVDLKDLLFLTAGASPSSDKGKGVTLPANITGTVSVAIRHLEYDAFQPADITGRLRIEPGRVYAEQVKMRAFNGELHGGLALNQLRDGSFSMDVAMNTSKADITMMFRQFNNFGQDDLEDKNLKGQLTSRLRMQSRLTPQLKFSMPTLEAVGELVVEQGELIDYEPIKALAKYTRLDDLSRIRFSTLRNEIRIVNEKVIIPEMMIRSDAVDLSVSGSQAFSGEIEYHIRMLLSDILSGKAKRNPNPELQAETDSRGRLTLFLVVDGTVADPRVRYDRRSQREKVQQEMQQEKEEIKGLIRKEFGTFIRQNDNPDATQGNSREGEIIIEWEDD